MGLTISQFDALDQYDKAMHISAGLARDKMTAWEQQKAEEVMERKRGA